MASEQLSAETWARTSASSTGYLLQQANRVEIRRTSSGNLQGAVYVDGAWRRASASVPGFHDGAWHHVVVTYDGAHVRLFLDGVEVAATEYAGVADPGIGVPLFIGGYSQGSSTWHGDLDEVVLHDRALDPAVIASLYATGSGTT